MRILFWQQNEVMGATEEYVSLLARRMVRDQDFDVAVAVPTISVDRWHAAVGPTVTVIAHHNAYRSAFRIVRRFAPDVVHVNDTGLRGLVASRMARRTTFLTWHTPAHHIRWNTHARVAARYGLSNKRLKVVVVSTENAVTLRANYGLDASFVIDPGVDEEKFAPRPDRADLRSRLAIAPTDFALVSLGRLEPQKAYNRLIECLPLVQEGIAKATNGEFNRALLLIAGEGSLRTELEGVITKLGLRSSARLLGWQADVRSLLGAADVFALASDFEGLPFATLEALACGVPLATTGVDGLRDLIDGTVGATALAKTPEGMADAILHVASNARAMGHAARARFLERYTATQTMDRTVDAYRSALSVEQARVLNHPSHRGARP